MFKNPVVVILISLGFIVLSITVTNVLVMVIPGHGRNVWGSIFTIVVFGMVYCTIKLEAYIDKKMAERDKINKPVDSNWPLR